MAENKDDICVVIQAIDSSVFFEKTIKFILTCMPNLIVSIWGKLSDTILQELRGVAISKVSLRSVFFGEHNYAISNNNVAEFISVSKTIDFHEHAWAIAINKVGIVLAKEDCDITICNVNFIDNRALVNFLEGIKADKVISEYEFVNE